MKKKQRGNTQLCILRGSIVFALMLILSNSAYGYVLTGSQILDHTAKKFARAKTLKLIQTVTLYDKQFDDGKILLNEVAYYREPDLFRSELSSKDTKRIHISSVDQAMIIIDDKIVSEFERGFDHYKDLIAFKDRMALQKRLQSLGIDTSVTRLERLNGRVAYVIGKKPSYGDVFPQLYVDKKTFLPIKWLMKANSKFNDNNDKMEVVFHAWRQHGGAYVPGRVEFFKNNELVKEIKTEKILINKGVSDILFNFDLIRARFALPELDGKQSIDSDEQDKAKKVIEGLDEIIENDTIAF